MILTICIPTYNRCTQLKNNLELLCAYITKNNCEKEIGLFISDNHSQDGTLRMLSEIKTQNPDILFIYHTNEDNIGASKNLVNLFKCCPTPYIMLLGDDDYISEEYLLGCLRQILSDHNLKCILPSYYNVTPEGKDLKRGRDLGRKSQHYQRGFRNCYVNSWRGHQLSGIVLENSGIYERIVENNIDNLYPQIFAVASKCLEGDLFHFTDFPVKVMRPPQSQKDWGYGPNGLISDIYENYSHLNITLMQRFLLEYQILDKQYWRCAMYLKKGCVDFFKCIWSICASKNTSIIMRMLIWLLVIWVFLKNAVTLLFKGKLKATLTTHVDA